MTETRTARAGLAFGVLKYVALWVLGSLVWIVLNDIVVPMRDYVDRTAQTEAAQTGIDYIMYQGWDWFPLWLGLLAAIMIYRRSTTEAALGGMR